MSSAIAQPLLTAESDPDALPDLRIAIGAQIAEAWLIAPTDRYQHFVQGSRYEAAGLKVRLSDGRVLSLMLPEDQVFEDRQPRIADIDDDGVEDIVLVLSSLTKGASLAVIGVKDDGLAVMAQTPYIGQPFRWLNPAGIADFDGDGQIDIAFVAMPHLIKRLEIWTMDQGRLRQIGSDEGFSNHRNGSVHTDMSAGGDFDGDGIADLALPGADRVTLRLVSFAGRQIHEFASHPLKATADGALRYDGKILRIGLSDGTTQQIALSK